MAISPDSSTVRVISGTARGHRLHGPPSNSATRPTSDKVREAIFNVLGPVTELRVLDLFCGTGALALEALSRGASTALLVDADDRIVRVCQRNLDDCSLNSQAKCLTRDVRRVLEKGPTTFGGEFDLVLMDPPYSLGLEREAMELLHKHQWLSEGATLVVERATRDVFEWPALIASFASEPYEKEYGDTSVAFFFGYQKEKSV